MVKAPWIIYAAYASEWAPLAAAAVRRPLPQPRRWVLVWCTLYVAMNTIGILLAWSHRNNHWVSHVFGPFQGASILWALASWQTRQVPRLTIRLTIPLFVAAWVVLFFTVENVKNFSTVAEPIYSMLALGTVLFTLVVRSLDATEPLPGQDWFWICIGLAIHFSALALLLPLAAALVNEHPDVVKRAVQVRSVLEMLAFFLIARGFLCQAPSKRSGVSFSPAA